MSVELKAKIEEYYSLKPARFRVLKSATLTQAIDPSAGEMQQHLALILASDDGVGEEMLHLELFGVRNLKLRQPEWSLVTLSNVEIIEAPPASKYDRRYVVLDAEEDIISCSCDDFRAVVG